MAEVRKRPLIELAVEACGLGDQPDGSDQSNGHVLVAADGAVLGAIGVTAVVRDAVDAGRIYRTAAEVASDEASLQTLVLVRLAAGNAVGDTWTLDGWGLLRAYGENADLRGAQLRGARLRGARLKGADLADADLYGADLLKADLSTANLTGAHLAGCDLFSASLQKADLTEADLSRADVRHADLREAICDRTAFRGADLWGTYMWNVDVSRAFTAGADFERSDYLNEKIRMS